MTRDEKTAALAVETLEARSVPSAALPPPFHADTQGGITFLPPGADSPVVVDGKFHPPAFESGSPAADHAAVWQRTEVGGAFLPVSHGYHDLTGFFGQ